MEHPERKILRLRDYDYSQNGAYFITICTKDKSNFLWQNVGETCGRPGETPSLTHIGVVINDEIGKISEIYQRVKINKYVIMPNHIHMIIVLQTNENVRPQAAPTIPRIIKQFKGSISKQVGFSMWQKSYYDRIIRNEAEYQEIWKYIDTNPLKWNEDKYFV